MKTLVLLLVACGSSSPPPPKPAPEVVAPKKVVADDRAKHDEIVAAHRKIEEEQQDALGQTCDAKVPTNDHPRCTPSCYATEPADPRTGKKQSGAVEIRHTVCERDGAYVYADEVEPLPLRKVKGRFPPAHTKGAWQQPIEAALVLPKLPRGDALVVSSPWRDLAHPLTHEKLRCVTVSHFTRSLRHPLDGCGGDGALACEATGNPAARGINVVHFRLAEAKAMQAANKLDDCQKAALEAIAVARGMPRWRQYAKLNVGKWVEHAGYRTRFDGVLDEDTLFATAATLGTEAEQIYTACGGGAPATKPGDEQSFHTCW